MNGGFKELELRIERERFGTSTKALWNGGEGTAWIAIRHKCRTYFNRKHLGDLLMGTELPPAALPADRNAWIEEQLQGSAEAITATRNQKYVELRSRFGLLNLNFGEPENLEGMNQVLRERYLQDRYEIQKDFHSNIGNLNLRRIEYQEKYRNAAVDYRKQMDRYEKKRIDCNQTFRELFGPAVMVMVEDLVNANQFLQSWNTINEHFNVTNPNLLRSMIIDRLNNFRYDQGSMTVGGACVMLEEMWEPLLTPPNTFSDDKKVSVLLKVYGDTPRFEDVVGKQRFNDNQV